LIFLESFMGQRGYAIAFFLVLLAACAGAFIGGRFLFDRIVGRSGPLAMAPVLTATPGIEQAGGDVQLDAPTSVPQPKAAIPTATRTPTRLVLTPFVPPTPTWEPTDTEEPPSPTPAETLTPEATATPESAFPFLMSHAVQNSSGDCSGNNLIVGRVTDRNGKGLADVRLRLTDEFNAVNDTRSTKSVANEVGKYDFPLFGPGRHFYVTIVDANGNPLSERADIAHGIGPEAKATCHTVDWKER
jgi:hypothetical protein